LNTARINSCPCSSQLTLLVGLGQWLILRFLLRGSGWWVVASAAGAIHRFSVSQLRFRGLLAWGGPDAWQTFLLVSLATACVGMLVGALQAGVLGRYVSGATRWLLISTVAWGIGWPFGMLVGSTISMRVDSTLADMLLGGTIWATVGAITGAGLVGLLNESPPVVFTQDPAPQEGDQVAQCRFP